MAIRYSSITSVQSLFNELTIEASETIIITSEITEWIETEEEILDARLKKFYTVPITDTVDKKIVAKIVTFKVAHIVAGVLDRRGHQFSEDEQKSNRGLDSEAERLFKLIVPKWNKCKCVYESPEAPLPNSGLQSVSPDTDSIFSTNTNNEATFEKGGNNW